MDTLNQEYIPVGDVRNTYSRIGYDGSAFYLSPRRKRDAVKWDGRDNCKVINLQYKDSDDIVANVGVYCCYEGKVYFYGIYEDRFLDSNGEIYILKEKYRIYKRINADTLGGLSCNGKINIKKDSEEYEYILPMDNDSLVDYMSTEIIKRGGLYDSVKNGNANVVILENDLVSLKLFTKVL